MCTVFLRNDEVGDALGRAVQGPHAPEEVVVVQYVVFDAVVNVRDCERVGELRVRVRVCVCG